jgi:hypothetical protein
VFATSQRRRPGSPKAARSRRLLARAGAVTIAGPVIYYLLGGDQATARLDVLKAWLAVHNAAVMTVLFLVFGADLIAMGIPQLT